MGITEEVQQHNVVRAPSRVPVQREWYFLFKCILSPVFVFAGSKINKCSLDLFFFFLPYMLMRCFVPMLSLWWKNANKCLLSQIFFFFFCRCKCRPIKYIFVSLLHRVCYLASSFASVVLPPRVGRCTRCDPVNLPYHRRSFKKKKERRTWARTKHRRSR